MVKLPDYPCRSGVVDNSEESTTQMPPVSSVQKILDSLMRAAMVLGAIVAIGVLI